MRGYVENIEALTLANENFRKVLYTAAHVQLVLMSLLPGQEIGEEVHDVDQFLRVEQGTGTAVINGASHDVSDGSAIIVPAGARHNVVNTGPGFDEALHAVRAAAPPRRGRPSDQGRRRFGHGR